MPVGTRWCCVGPPKVKGQSLAPLDLVHGHDLGAVGGQGGHGGQLRLEHLGSEPLEDLPLAARGGDGRAHRVRPVHHCKHNTGQTRWVTKIVTGLLTVNATSTTKT